MYDDFTGHDLDRNEVMKSMLNNVEGLASMGVWDVAPRKQCIGRMGREPIRGRWGGINKGDDIKVCRSRYVLMEIRKMHGENAKEGLFVAIHLLEALKLLISLTVGNGHKAHVKDAHKLMFIDISEAYLNADVINAELYVELPADMNLPNHCGHLNEALYGTRDAAKCWENPYPATISEQGYDRGKASPCMFKHAASGSSLFIPGDDFVVVGPRRT